MRATDVIFEADLDLEDLMACYWHLTESAETALDCTSQDCHHADADKEQIETYYTEQLAGLCHRFAKLIAEVM